MEREMYGNVHVVFIHPAKLKPSKTETKARELGDPRERTDDIHDVDSDSPGRGVSAEAFPSPRDACL